MPILLAHLVPQRPGKQLDQHHLHPVLLDVDLHQLHPAAALFEDPVQGRVLLGGDKGLDLVLGPHAAEDGDDGGVAGEEGGGVCFLAGGQGAAEEVGEVEGEVGFEEAGGREEGFAFVEGEVDPVAEVRAGDFVFATERKK